jgi:hypothetical protein
MKISAYVIICSFLFALLDWKVVQYTRVANRDWLDWMHDHERQYAAVTRTAEFVLCAPALALKPIFYYAAMSSEASQEEQDAVLHSPKPTAAGFYHLPVRGQAWTFVSWFWWFAYWTPISLLWWIGARRVKWLR